MTRSELAVKMLEDVISRIREGSVKVDNYSYRDYVYPKEEGKIGGFTEKPMYHIDIRLDYKIK